MQRGECRWDQTIQKNEREKGDDYRGKKSGRDIYSTRKPRERTCSQLINRPLKCAQKQQKAATTEGARSIIEHIYIQW